MGKAYGFFEISGLTSAITAIDIMCKTAEVELVTWEKKLGGRLVTVIIRGNVSAVTQAMEAAAEHGMLKPVVQLTIPSPHEEILKVVHNSANLSL